MLLGLIFLKVAFTRMNPIVLLQSGLQACLQGQSAVYSQVGQTLDFDCLFSTRANFAASKTPLLLAKNVCLLVGPS
jgi:hypothetical protein